MAWEYAPLNWTTSPPQQKGQYWVRFPDGEIDCIEVIEIIKSGLPLFGIKNSPYKPTHWLGPLPVPEMPGEGE